MKTPREILFARHRDAEPKLDVIRRKALAALPASDEAEALKLTGTNAPRFKVPSLNKLWLELIWPSRRAWAAMAAVWLAVLAANLQMKATSPPAPGLRRVQNRELLQSFQEQRRLLAELLPPPGPSPAVAAPPKARPRSERSAPFKAC